MKGSDWCKEEERRRRKSRKGGGEERRWEGKARKRGQEEERSGKGRESLQGSRLAGRATGLEREHVGGGEGKRRECCSVRRKGEGVCSHGGGGIDLGQR